MSKNKTKIDNTIENLTAISIKINNLEKTLHNLQLNYSTAKIISGEINELTKDINGFKEFLVNPLEIEFL